MCCSGASEQPVERKRPRKPKKDGGNASRNVATKRPDTAGPSNAIRQPQPQQPPVAARSSTAVEPSSDAMQRPTRLAVLEAKIMEDAAVEEALGCTGRVVPLEVTNKYAYMTCMRTSHVICYPAYCDLKFALLWQLYAGHI